MNRWYDCGQGANLDGTDSQGQTALWIAVLKNKAEAVTWLLEKGANHHLKPKQRSRPFVEAARLGKIDALYAFLSSTRKLSQNSHYKAFAAVALTTNLDRRDREYMLKALFRARRMNEVRLLIIEVIADRLFTVELLMSFQPKLGKSLTVTEKHRQPLSYARSKEMVDVLLKHGARLDIQDSDGLTPYKRVKARSGSNQETVNAFVTAAKEQETALRTWDYMLEGKAKSYTTSYLRSSTWYSE